MQVSLCNLGTLLYRNIIRCTIDWRFLIISQKGVSGEQLLFHTPHYIGTKTLHQLDDGVLASYTRDSAFGKFLVYYLEETVFDEFVLITNKVLQFADNFDIDSVEA